MHEPIDIVIPVIKKALRVPKGVSRLAFQLNYRGLHTKDIVWADPVRIELESYHQFQKYVELWRKSKKSQVHKLFKYIADELKYELFIRNPMREGNHCELLKVVILVPQSKIEEFTQIFYAAHLSQTKKSFITLAK